MSSCLHWGWPASSWSFEYKPEAVLLAVSYLLFKKKNLLLPPRLCSRVISSDDKASLVGHGLRSRLRPCTGCVTSPSLHPAGGRCCYAPSRHEESRCRRLGNWPKVTGSGSGRTPGAPAARGCSLNHVASTVPSAGGTGCSSGEGCRVTRVGSGYWGGGDGDTLSLTDSPLATPLSHSESP